MAYAELGYDDVGYDDDGGDVGAYDVGASRQRFGLPQRSNLALIARRAQLAMQARGQAQISQVARAVGRPTVQAVATSFSIEALMGAAVTTAQATAQPLQGMDPDRITLEAYDTTAVASAAGTNLWTAFQVGMASQLASAAPRPFTMYAPGSFNSAPFSASRIPAYATVLFGWSRTIAPGAGAALMGVINIQGKTVTASV